MKPQILIRIILSAGILLALGGMVQGASAQTSTTRRPVDMMIVLDNSCSMFPKEMIPTGCTSFGSDVDFLRIKGADLFIARLGYDQDNEGEYQLGVISLGDEPVVQSPLGPLMGNRDLIANRIAEPIPQKATRFVPALQKAYIELRDSPTHKPSNLPAIVLITDGVPYPPEGQSNEDIEKLISQNDDIPLFMLILKGAESNLEEFDEYAEFWKDMQTQHDNVHVYLIENDSQIETTYNKIVALLQDTIPTEGQLVSPGSELLFFVGEYTAKVVLTISSPPGISKGTVQVIDPRNEVVKADEPGVAYFRGSQNPVEIYSISAPRLADELKNQYWKVISDYVTTVFIDREGTYRINFLSPSTTPTDINNVYQVGDSQSARQPFQVKFNLLDDGEPVLEKQSIQVEVLLPNGTQLLVPTTLLVEPDEQGIYEVVFDVPSFSPYGSTKFGRFNFVIHAGLSGESGGENTPNATARLLVDVGPRPFVQLITPSRLDCTREGGQKIMVTIGDYQSVISDTLKVTASGPGGQVELEGKEGEYRGDLAPLCQPLLADLPCGQVSLAEFQIELRAQLVGNQQLDPWYRSIPVEINAVECTPTPGPTEAIFVLPTPRPTPVPDTDQDGYGDLIDPCPQQAGTALFNGCQPPWWFYLLGVAAIIGVIVLFIGLIWPWLSVRTVRRPPELFILVCRKENSAPEFVDLHELGIKRRTNKICIGSNPRKAHLIISGLKPVEFTVRDKGEKIVVLDTKGEVKVVVRQLNAEKISTSNPEIKLFVAGKRSALEKIKC